MMQLLTNSYTVLSLFCSIFVLFSLHTNASQKYNKDQVLRKSSRKHRDKQFFNLLSTQCRGLLLFHSKNLSGKLPLEFAY